ncbi:MAG: hypothetical protein V8R43_10680 [Dorea sp.]
MRAEIEHTSFFCPQKIRKNSKNKKSPNKKIKNIKKFSKKHLPNDQVYGILNIGRVTNTKTKYMAPWSSG